MIKKAAAPGVRGRRPEHDPAIPVTRLFEVIRHLGYEGSFNLLCRYVTQARVEGDRPPVSARRLTRYLLTHPTTEITSASR